MNEFCFDTRAVRAGSVRTDFNEHSEALFLTSSFCFDSAAEAAERFAHPEAGFTYSRVGNPSVAMFEGRLAALEGAEACLATASGMSAIMAVMMGLMSAGDHLVSSRSIFGSTMHFFDSILRRFGIETTFVDFTDTAAWQQAILPNTKVLFLETPSNPLTEVADIAALSHIARTAGCTLVVDNCLCTPALQQPFKLGADIVVHSATKYLDGQGRVMGGAIVGSREILAEKIFPFVRTAGPTLSPFNAWILLKGLETLGIRMERQSQNALILARALAVHPSVQRVWYPGLPSHPQYTLASSQQRAGGALFSFEVKGNTPEAQREHAWRVIDNLTLCSITANLGDTRTTLTHPASTTHGRISAQARSDAGIEESLLRVAVGLEDPADLFADITRGLCAAY